MEIHEYVDAHGARPFARWFRKLKDIRGKARILTCLKRIEKSDHFGDCAPVGAGVFERRIDTGPGYRVYFGYEREGIVLLLIGGDKATQQRDVSKAREYWWLHKGI